MEERAYDLTSRFPLSDRLAVDCIVRELDKHGFRTSRPDGNPSVTTDTSNLTPESKIELYFKTPDNLLLQLRHIPASRIPIFDVLSYLIVSGGDYQSREVFGDTFFHSLQQSYEYRMRNGNGN